MKFYAELDLFIDFVKFKKHYQLLYTQLSM